MPFKLPENVHVLRRTTVVVGDSSQNFRLAELQDKCDLLALRPTDDKTFAQCCQSLECDIISLDLSTRHYYRFKHSTLSAAVQSGKKVELCYAPGISTADPVARRNLIQNAGELIRATRGGRGIIISSEAQNALGCRGPWDIINLAVIWGLGQERGHEAVSTEARKCVNAAKLKRSSYRGAIDVVYGGEKPEKPVQRKEESKAGQKRAALDEDEQPGMTISNRQKRRLAHEARMKAAAEPKAKDVDQQAANDEESPRASAKTRAKT